MNHIQNTYQDYAHCLHNEDRVHFLSINDKEAKYGSHDLENKLTFFCKLP